MKKEITRTVSYTVYDVIEKTETGYSQIDEQQTRYDGVEYVNAPNAVYVPVYEGTKKLRLGVREFVSAALQYMGDSPEAGCE